MRNPWKTGSPMFLFTIWTKQGLSIIVYNSCPFVMLCACSIGNDVILKSHQLSSLWCQSVDLDFILSIECQSSDKLVPKATALRVYVYAYL